jgi:hypothetical protein
MGGRGIPVISDLVEEPAFGIGQDHRRGVIHRIAAALLVLVLALPTLAGPFDAPPERYDETVNVALQQVGTSLGVRQTACTAARCRFAAREVSVEVAGPVDRGATERITVAATFRQGDDGAAASLLEKT